MEPPWDNLPDLVLAKVFGYLSDKAEDRYNAALVCKSWSRAFRSPQIWRKMRLDFSSLDNPTSFGKKPFKFVQSLGEYLKELEMKMIIGSPLMSKSSLNLDNFIRFLLVLTQKPVKLEKFTLNICCLWHLWNNDWKKKKLEELISKFLGTQSNLKYFDMSSSYLSQEVGLDFLSQLAKNNSRSMRILNLKSYFSWGDEVLLSSPDYQSVMGSFKNLVELNVSFSCIDSNLLRRIVGNCSHSLKIIKIWYCLRDQDADVIPKSTWAWVKKTSPQLEIHFDIFGDVTSLSDLIPLETGLHSFTMNVRWVDDTPTAQELNSVLIHLCQFRDTLVKIKVEGFENFDDRLLIQLISSCSKLKEFEMTGDCSIQTLKRLYEMKMEGSIHLNVCRLTLLLENIWIHLEENRSAFKEQGIEIT